MKLLMKEFRPCDDYENGIFVFGDTSLWMDDPKTLIMNTTLNVKEEIDDTFRVNMFIKLLNIRF